MPDFAYRAATARGDIVRGVERGLSRPSVERVLADRGLVPLEIEIARASRRRGRLSLRRRGAEVADAIHYLATLMSAGFTLERALATTAGVAIHPDVAAALSDVQARLRAGADLADAFAAHPRCFPPVAVGMVRAGVRGGHLADALADLATHLEAEEELRQELLAALAYPALLAVVGGSALLVLLLFVLPRLAGTFGDLGAALPPATANLLRLGRLLRHGWGVLLGVGAVGAGALVLYRRSPDGRARLHRLLLHLPVVGTLRQQVTAVRFGRMLAALLRSGMPVSAAMDVGADGVTDTAAAAEIRHARAQVEAGSKLAGALGESQAFPRLFVQMVEVGEESGRLPDLLARAAAVTERDLRRGLARAVRLVEPAFIVLFGLVAGLVAYGLLQTVYGLRIDALQ